MQCFPNTEQQRLPETVFHHEVNEKTWRLKQQLGDLCNVNRCTLLPSDLPVAIGVANSQATPFWLKMSNLCQERLLFFFFSATDCWVCLVFLHHQNNRTCQTTMSSLLVFHFHTKHRECLCDLRIASLSWNKNSPSMNVLSNTAGLNPLMYGQKSSFSCSIISVHLIRCKSRSHIMNYCFVHAASASFLKVWNAHASALNWNSEPVIFRAGICMKWSGRPAQLLNMQG